jgi:hypothetical protein
MDFDDVTANCPVENVEVLHSKCIKISYIRLIADENRKTDRNQESTTLSHFQEISTIDGKD